MALFAVLHEFEGPFVLRSDTLPSRVPRGMEVREIPEKAKHKVPPVMTAKAKVGVVTSLPFLKEKLKPNKLLKHLPIFVFNTLFIMKYIKLFSFDRK